MQRSKKYIQYTDQQIIDLHVAGVEHKHRHFLDLEIRERGLVVKADKERKNAVRKNHFSFKKMAGALVILVLLLMRYGNKIFQ
jgi:hypothetical protein